MKRTIYYKILLALAIAALLMKLTIGVIIEPWIGGKTALAISKYFPNSITKIEKVHISVIPAGIEFENITLSTKPEASQAGNLNANIDFLRFKGIHLIKLLFHGGIDIREVSIGTSTFDGYLLFPEKGGSPIISKSDIRIETLVLDHLELSLKNTSDSRKYQVKNGVLKLQGVQIARQDTLSARILDQLDFNADQLVSVSADSLYTFCANGVISSSNSLNVTSFYVHPNYSNYDFTDKFKYQTDRFEGEFQTVKFCDFSVADFVKSGKLKCSYAETGELNLKVFRDKRKNFNHIIKLPFQDMIYNYPGVIQIDSIAFLKGNIIYSEHAAKANHPGAISFEKVNAKIYSITNDTIYKTKLGYLNLNARALLMGKGKLEILLKGRIFDPANTFSVNGTLGSIALSELNPILENNGFILSSSGRIKTMNFSYISDNIKSTGSMTMLYSGLKIALKNKRTEKTQAIKEKVGSVIANMLIIDSNPVPHEAVRIGTIEQSRDQERFLINYCFKSILSGIKSSILKSPQKK